MACVFPGAPPIGAWPWARSGSSLCIFSGVRPPSPFKLISTHPEGLLIVAFLIAYLSSPASFVVRQVDQSFFAPQPPFAFAPRIFTSATSLSPPSRSGWCFVMYSFRMEMPRPTLSANWRLAAAAPASRAVAERDRARAVRSR